MLARMQSLALAPNSITSHLQLNEEPLANVQRYGHLRQTTQREVKSLAYQMKAARFPAHRAAMNPTPNT